MKFFSLFKKITSKKAKRIVWWTNKYVNALVEQEGYTRAEAVEIAHFELISSIEEEFKKKFKSDFEE
uniref:Phage protein n=1 Tax=Rhizobium phage LG08 TaxID=3129229 RepID=A0AAU8HYE2_9CAUD